MPARQGFDSMAVADQAASDFATLFATPVLQIMKGTVPATEAALAGNLSASKIATIKAPTVHHTDKWYFFWASQVAGSGLIGRDMASQPVLLGTVESTGTGTYLLITNEVDDLTANSTAPRSLWTLGTSGTDVVLANVVYNTIGEVISWASDVSREFFK